MTPLGGRLRARAPLERRRTDQSVVDVHTAPEDGAPVPCGELGLQAALGADAETAAHPAEIMAVVVMEIPFDPGHRRCLVSVTPVVQGTAGSWEKNIQHSKEALTTQRRRRLLDHPRPSWGSFGTTLRWATARSVSPAGALALNPQRLPLSHHRDKNRITLVGCECGDDSEADVAVDSGGADASNRGFAARRCAVSGADADAGLATPGKPHRLDAGRLRCPGLSLRAPRAGFAGRTHQGM